MKYTEIDLMTEKEVLEKLKLNASRILMGMVRRGEFPPPIMVGGRSRWPKEDLVRWLQIVSKDRWEEDAAMRQSEMKLQPKLAESLPEQLVTFRGSLYDAAHGPAVYFLIKDGMIVYIGSSINPLRRVNEHRTGTEKTAPKEFDRTFFYPVTLEELLEVEKTMVARFNPPLNINLRTDTEDQRRKAATDELKP